MKNKKEQKNNVQYMTDLSIMNNLFNRTAIMRYLNNPVFQFLMSETGHNGATELNGDILSLFTLTWTRVLHGLKFDCR
jgi:hypothetical protein